ncbi:MAG: hypothetical protein ABEJ86_01615 [Halococcoides sp.]
MATHQSIDYGRWTKLTFVAGAALFAIGAIGHLVTPTLTGPVPAWTQSALFDLEVMGVLVALLLSLVFGIVLPLLE